MTDAKPHPTITKASQDLHARLAELDIKNLERETEAKAKTLDLPYFNLSDFPVSLEALGLIEEEQAAAFGTICFFYDGKNIKLGSINPNNPQVSKLITELGNEHHAKVEILFISSYSLQKALSLYEKIPKIKKEIGGVAITSEDIKRFQGSLASFEDLQKNLTALSVTEKINFILASAIQTESSDIHIEAESDSVKIRFRIDGILHTVAALPFADWPKLISRIKLISGLKINIVHQPQDGRFTIFLDNNSIDIRVSTIPTFFGESIVMRLLMSSKAGLSFDQLGIRGKSFVDLKHEIERPNGMIITTGPTGSGKTTTLYAILNKLNTSDTKIITLEDPIEYKLTGINQSQIDHGKDYTFANGLRSILRQDPDVVMVGEIRDLETAETSINAALTGHLVLSTIHTNSAAGAIPRFLAMGVKPFLLGPALNAVIGQRLVRKLCPKCKVEDKIDNDTLTKILNLLNTIPVKSAARLTEEETANLKFYKSTGCPDCHSLGYKGRIGIYEIMTMTKEIEQLILSEKASEYTIQDIAVTNGMVTMVQDGLLKAKDGITSIEEIFNVAE
ncbi:MAG: GspE/PulE family protein [Candidatus Komeilibacteria bacterium]|nr:GspE/PulE family protein [Candidatus Komeilibacteria bacterium]